MERRRYVIRQFLSLILGSVIVSVPTALVMLASLSWLAFPAHIEAQQRTDLPYPGSPQARASAIDAKQVGDPKHTHHKFPAERRAGGILEEIPKKYNDRYQKWKKEFLASGSGRQQWDTYAHHPRLVLTITISSDGRNGAKTGAFEWDDSGSLIAATMALGPRIDEGYPNPAYYPVLSSLKPLESKLAVGNILAAAKFAHEFGHVDQASAGGGLYRRQTEIAHIYNSILLSNGHDTQDPRLKGLTREIGGTPADMCEEREYRAEETAMRYLLDRISNRATRRALLAGVERMIGLYAKNFGKRFTKIAHSELSRSRIAVGSKRPTGDIQTLGGVHFHRLLRGY